MSQIQKTIQFSICKISNIGCAPPIWTLLVRWYFVCALSVSRLVCTSCQLPCVCHAACFGQVVSFLCFVSQHACLCLRPTPQCLPCCCFGQVVSYLCFVSQQACLHLLPAPQCLPCCCFSQVVSYLCFVSQQACLYFLPAPQCLPCCCFGQVVSYLCFVSQQACLYFLPAPHVCHAAVLVRWYLIYALSVSRLICTSCQLPSVCHVAVLVRWYLSILCQSACLSMLAANLQCLPCCLFWSGGILSMLCQSAGLSVLLASSPVFAMLLFWSGGILSMFCQSAGLSVLAASSPVFAMLPVLVRWYLIYALSVSRLVCASCQLPSVCHAACLSTLLLTWLTCMEFYWEGKWNACNHECLLPSTLPADRITDHSHILLNGMPLVAGIGRGVLFGRSSFHWQNKTSWPTIIRKVCKAHDRSGSDVSGFECQNSIFCVGCKCSSAWQQ